MPMGIRQVVAALPLSQSSGIIRGIASGEGYSPWAVVILLAYLVAFSLISVGFIYKKKNL